MLIIIKTIYYILLFNNISTTIVIFLNNSIKTNTCFSLKQEAVHCGWVAGNVSQWNMPQKAVRSRIYNQV